jgi:hypothetical protein
MLRPTCCTLRASAWPTLMPVLRALPLCLPMASRTRLDRRRQEGPRGRTGVPMTRASGCEPGELDARVLMLQWAATRGAVLGRGTCHLSARGPCPKGETRCKLGSGEPPCRTPQLAVRAGQLSRPVGAASGAATRPRTAGRPCLGHSAAPPQAAAICVQPAGKVLPRADSPPAAAGRQPGTAALAKPIAVVADI